MSRALIAVACLSLFACPETPATDGGTGGGTGSTGGGTGSTGGGSATPTVETWCTTQSSSGCTAGVTCNYYESELGCTNVTTRNAEYGTGCGANTAAAKDGRSTFNASAAQSCLDNLGTCGSLGCPAAFTGVVGVDGGCYQSDECDPSLFCEIGARCPGRCVPRRAEGARGSNARECEPGLYGKLTVFDAGGFGTVCTRQAAAGEPCSGYQSCLDPFVCNPNSNTCVPLLAEGNACGATDGGIAAYQVCVLPMWCQPRFDGGVATCAPLAKRGEPCGTCQQDLRCVLTTGATNGTCQSLGQSGEGCNLDRDCLYPLYCKATGQIPFGPGTCATRGDAGASCTTDQSCAPGLSCVVRGLNGNVCAVVDGGTTLGCRDTTP
ncbi:MAG: Dickkopf N-terminal cysteine-rich domain-containing protein [Archangium sp.]